MFKFEKNIIRNATVRIHLKVLQVLENVAKVILKCEAGITKLYSSVKQALESLSEFMILFICYLNVPRPTYGHYQGESFFHHSTDISQSILLIFERKVTGNLITRLDH